MNEQTTNAETEICGICGEPGADNDYDPLGATSTELDMCEKCENTGWVCENCGTRWERVDGTTCCGAGKPCDCNPEGHVEWAHVFASTNPRDEITCVH